MSSITLDDDTPTTVSRRGSVEVEGGTFINVLSVPSLSTNLLSVYQITHLGEGMRVQFSPYSIEIRMLHIDTTIIVGRAYCQFRLYTFLNFVPNISLAALLTHSDGVSKLWHERFGHLNYHYLE